MKVLLVDDDEDTRFMLRRQLSQKRQFKVVGEAGDGNEALAQIEELEPDLVIMDVRMPGMDGIEATRLVKERFPDVSVLAFSSFADEEHIQAMRDAGAIGYVLKDTPADELVMRLQDAM